MSYQVKDIMHETAHHFVIKVRGGFEVYRIGQTCSVRCAVIGWKGAVGKERAITECNRRESEIT